MNPFIASMFVPYLFLLFAKSQADGSSTTSQLPEISITASATSTTTVAYTFQASVPNVKSPFIISPTAQYDTVFIIAGVLIISTFVFFFLLRVVRFVQSYKEASNYNKEMAAQNSYLYSNSYSYDPSIFNFQENKHDKFSRECSSSTDYTGSTLAMGDTSGETDTLNYTYEYNLYSEKFMKPAHSVYSDESGSTHVNSPITSQGVNGVNDSLPLPTYHTNNTSQGRTLRNATNKYNPHYINNIPNVKMNRKSMFVSPVLQLMSNVNSSTISNGSLDVPRANFVKPVFNDESSLSVGSLVTNNPNKSIAAQGVPVYSNILFARPIGSRDDCSTLGSSTDDNYAKNRIRPPSQLLDELMFGKP